MATEDQILLKLVIQGQSPDEIQRLARSTQGQLNDEIRKHLDELSRLHKQAAQQITAEQLAETKKRIDAEEKQIDTVAKVMRANEIAANRSANAWKGTLEVMENIATSAKFMYGVISSGLSSLHSLAESVDRVTNVYGALKGSIAEMREASKGEISDYDLITTKNRAMEKELELTDSQFGAVAAAADNFADSLGVNTKEALDKIIDGLATGRVKMLEHAGVVINVDEAYAKYAKSIGVAVDQLNDHGKKIAVVRESLREMDQKLAESGKGVDDFSHRYEKMVASLKNSTDQVLLSLGELGVKIFELFETTIPRGIRHTIAAVNDVADLLNPLTGFTKGHRLQDEKAFDALEDKHKAEAADKTAREAAARLAAGTSYNYQQGSVADSIDNKKVAQDADKLAREVKAAQEEFMKKFSEGKGLNSQDDASVLFALSGMPSQVRPEDFAAGRASAAAPRGLSGGLARQSALQKAFAGKTERDQLDMDRQEAQAAEAMAKVNEDALNEMLDKADKLRERAGNGIFATILFGPSGREELLDDIDSFKNSAADAMGIVADAGMKMAEALGASLAAFISGDKNKRKSVRDTTHDILEALAAQAYTRAIFETAEGLASLALGPIGGASAAAHFAAAGMFTAVGTAAGLGSRAIGQSSTGSGATSGTGAGAGAGTGTGSGQGSGISSSGNNFGSGGMRSSGNGGGGAQNITIVVNSQFTTQAEVGRAINLALAESYARDGRGVPVSMGSV